MIIAESTYDLIMHPAATMARIFAELEKYRQDEGGFTTGCIFLKVTHGGSEDRPNDDTHSG